MLLNFDVGNFFVPTCFSCVDEALKSENPEYLGDMIRIQTVVHQYDALKHPFDILRYFGLKFDLGKIGESVWEVVEDIRIKVFTEMLALTGNEYRLDWSRKDGAFCIFFRERDMGLDATRDIVFVKKNTLSTIKHASIANSQVHGFGLFSTTDIDADTTLGYLDGQILSLSSYESVRHSLNNAVGNLKNHFFMEWNAMPTGNLLVRALRTNYSYINHSQKPNLILIHGDNNVLVTALEDIRTGDELFLDYRKENIPKHYFTLLGADYLKEFIQSK